MNASDLYALVMDEQMLDALIKVVQDAVTQPHDDAGISRLAEYISGLVASRSEYNRQEVRRKKLGGVPIPPTGIPNLN